MSLKTVTPIVEGILEEVSHDTLLIVNPETTVLKAIVKTVTDTNPEFDLQILAHDQELQQAVDDFLVASRLADLIHQNQCLIHLIQANESNQLILTEDHLWTIITVGDTAEPLSTTNQEFTGTVFQHYSDTWEEADEYSLRTPPLTRVRETAQEAFGPSFETDLMDVLTTASANGDSGLNVVEASLLVAARHEELLYDISKWGEDTGVASKATFSRTKTRLEDADLITTEKVPIDVGRPRLRLMLTDDLTNAAINELTWTAEDKLHSLTA